MLLQEKREELIAVAQQIQKDKLVPLTFGNFSLRDFETGYVCITPSGMLYDQLKPEDIVVVDVDGKHVDGDRLPSIEKDLHCAVFRNRPEVGAVVHTHSTFVTTWACCNKAIPTIVAEVAALVKGKIKCAPYALCGSQELADVTAEYLKDDDAVLMANHGVLVVADSIQRAYVNAVIVEEGAKVAFYAEQLGGMYVFTPEECETERLSANAGYGQR
ncbi:L-fuculose-phosphate aldolase [Gottschalkiaceae bacterium SANA]|nr:L-fuculose-phosphate aldolase [Gottschalkiaceae bacterium SANA]